MGGGKDGGGQSEAILAEQMKMASEQWKIYKQVYLPYQKEQVAANMQLIKPGLELSKAQLAGQLEMQPLQQEAAMGGWQNIVSGMKDAAPVQAEFFKEALEGPDVEARIGDMTADVNQIYHKARQQATRSLSRMGMMPGSGRMTGAFADIAAGQAKEEVAGRHRIRRGAEEERFSRLAEASRFGSHLASQGTGAMGGYQAGPTSFGNPQFQTGANTWAQAASTAGGIASRQGGGWQDFMGSMAGKFAGGLGGSYGSALGKKWGA